jgi:hypothetical protein
MKFGLQYNYFCLLKRRFSDVSIAYGVTCDTFALMHSDACLAGCGAIDLQKKIKSLPLEKVEAL